MFLVRPTQGGWLAGVVVSYASVTQSARLEVTYCPSDVVGNDAPADDHRDLKRAKHWIEMGYPTIRSEPMPAEANPGKRPSGVKWFALVANGGRFSHRMGAQHASTCACLGGRVQSHVVVRRLQPASFVVAATEDV